MKYLRHKYSLISALLVTGITVTSCANYPYSPATTVQRIEASPQYRDGKFHNKVQTQVFSLEGMWNGMKEVVFNKHPDATPASEIPIVSVQQRQFSAIQPESKVRFTRLGHSTLLIRLGQQNWLTDPVFSERVSPLQWIGPERFHDVPLDLNDLPDITGVVISHNHYDHLDENSIKLLSNQVKHFVVPLGIGDALRKWGVDEAKIIELDWWQDFEVAGVQVVSTPAQHFSGRGITDGDETLWSSWVIRTNEAAVYFSGDTGYFEGFKEIGERFGPFDYAFMECGAYNEQWRDIHMLPEDTLQAFLDVKGKVLVPVHNSTFDLSTHAWYDPYVQINALAQRHGVELLTPVIGNTVDSSQPISNFTSLWWQPNTISHIDTEEK